MNAKNSSNNEKRHIYYNAWGNFFYLKFFFVHIEFFLFIKICKCMHTPLFNINFFRWGLMGLNVNDYWSYLTICFDHNSVLSKIRNFRENWYLWQSILIQVLFRLDSVWMNFHALLYVYIYYFYFRVRLAGEYPGTSQGNNLVLACNLGLTCT